jgi:hypothetical protein
MLMWASGIAPVERFSTFDTWIAGFSHRNDAHRRCAMDELTLRLGLCLLCVVVADTHL